MTPDLTCPFCLTSLKIAWENESQAFYGCTQAPNCQGTVSFRIMHSKANNLWSKHLSLTHPYVDLVLTQYFATTGPSKIQIYIAYDWQVEIPPDALDLAVVDDKLYTRLKIMLAFR